MLGQPEQAPVGPGEVLAGKYRVERVVAQGGMGVVVAATHLELGELRAIKFMRPAALANEQAEERFLREARASAKLRSEHVVRIHDIGRLDDGVPYLVMEYLVGDNLKHVLTEQGPLPIPTAVDFVLQAVEALAEAHAAGIVHRDLKPPNLFVTRGNDGRPFIKLLDFGISKLTGALAEEAGVELTQTTMMMGSPLYMSPEQMASARDIDARCDIWALGVILFELLTGKRPFRGKTITAVTMDVATRQADPPSILRPEIPPALDAVVTRCLAKDREERFPNVVLLAEALSPFADADSLSLIERIRRVHQLSSPLAVALPRPSLLSDRDRTPMTGSGVRNQAHRLPPPPEDVQETSDNREIRDRDSPTVVFHASGSQPPSVVAPPVFDMETIPPRRPTAPVWLVVPATVLVVAAVSGGIAAIALSGDDPPSPPASEVAPAIEVPPNHGSEPEPNVASEPEENHAPSASTTASARVASSAPKPRASASAPPAPSPVPTPKRDPFGESWR